jgi:hypothetical protein
MITGINDFQDFCLVVYVLVDDVMQGIQPLLRWPGPQPLCSNSELLAMVLIGECKGWDVETELLSNLKEYKHLFPHQPTQSRFNRRRRRLAEVLNFVRQCVVAQLDLAVDRQCAIDSLPVPVVSYYHAPDAGSDWRAHGAAIGIVPSKKQKFFGFRLHTLVTLGGLILDFELAPANERDLTAGLDILGDYTDLTTVADKAYIHAAHAAALHTTNRVELLTVPRRNQKVQLPKAVAHLINGPRQIIETVNSQLVQQFHIETNHAHTFRGLCARLYAKLTAHTLCIYINRLLGTPDWLQIKQLAFPI